MALRHLGRYVGRHAVQWHSKQWTMGLHTTVARGGVIGTVRSTISQAVKGSEEKREGKAFEAQMKYLTDQKRMVDANVYMETIGDLKKAVGLSGFREHLPWVQNNPLLEDMKQEEAILGSLSEYDSRNPAFVSIRVKKEIARATKADLSQVESLLGRVCMMYDIQKWMLKRMKADMPLPATSAQLQAMLSTPGSGLKRSFTFRKKWPSPGVKPKKKRAPL